jgi:RNA polymerase sigma-70 factor (ECF subfamily)
VRVSEQSREGASSFVDEARACESWLRAVALRLCGNRADAQDLVQDVYERAFRRFEALRPDSNVRAWLTTILHNLFIDRCRAARRTPKVVPLTDALPQHEQEQQEPPAWATIPADQVREAIATLPREFRAVYELHAAGRSYDEIAETLGLPKATVGTRLLRARRKLKTALLSRTDAGRVEESLR